MCYSFRDGPSAPLPLLLIVLCRCDRVFLGLLQPLFTVVLCIFFFVLSSSAKCTFASVTWWPGHESRCLLTNWVVEPRVRDDRILFSSPRTNHSAAYSNWDKPPTFILSCFHFALKSLYHLPFTTRCAYMCECECMCPVYENVCTDSLSSSVLFFCYPAGTNWWQPLLEPLWLSEPFFYFALKLKKLEFSPMTL